MARPTHRVEAAGGVWWAVGLRAVGLRAVGLRVVGLRAEAQGQSMQATQLTASTLDSIVSGLEGLGGLCKGQKQKTQSCYPHHSPSRGGQRRRSNINPLPGPAGRCLPPCVMETETGESGNHRLRWERHSMDTGQTHPLRSPLLL